MRNFEGIYRPAKEQAPKPADVRLIGSKLVIDLQEEGATSLEWDLANLDVRYLEGNGNTVVRPFPGSPESVTIEGKGAHIELAPLVAGKPASWKKEEKRFPWLAFYMMCGIIIAFFVALYFLLVPYISEKLAMKVSVAREEQFGESIYHGMSLKTDSNRSILVNQFFRHLDVETPYNIKIAVVKGDEVNAFALPGGRIVVYDGLLDRLQSYPELAALLSHEFTHVQEKHATRSVFRKLGSTLFISLLTGNSGKIGAVLGEKANELGSLSYSRSLEKEADLNGLIILQRKQIDPAGFRNLFSRLKEAGEGRASTPEILASHPDLDARIAYVNEKAGSATFVNDTTLANLFSQINSSTKKW